MATVRATVEIFGQRLGLRAEGDAAYLQQLARFVDQRMREVADQTSSADTVRVAILAALNIADELYAERENDRDPRDLEFEEHAERLVGRLEEVLADGGDAAAT